MKLSSTNTIWMYWEDKPGTRKPDYLELFRKTILRNISDNTLINVTPENLSDFLPELSKRVFKIYKIAHRADYIRDHLLKKYGSFWLDSDVVLLKTLKLVNLFKNYAFVGYGEKKKGILPLISSELKEIAF